MLMMPPSSFFEHDIIFAIIYLPRCHFAAFFTLDAHYAEMPPMTAHCRHEFRHDYYFRRCRHCPPRRRRFHYADIFAAIISPPFRCRCAMPFIADNIDKTLPLSDTPPFHFAMPRLPPLFSLPPFHDIIYLSRRVFSCLIITP